MRDAPEPSKSPAAARAAKKAAEAAQAAQAASEAQGNANDDTNGDGITRIPGQATGLADSSGDTQDAVSQNAQAAKPSYSSDAASHPFAVPEKTSLEHVNGDVLQEELPNTMRPAEPLPNGDSNGGVRWNQLHSTVDVLAMGIEELKNGPESRERRTEGDVLRTESGVSRTESGSGHARLLKASKGIIDGMRLDNRIYRDERLIDVESVEAQSDEGKTIPSLPVMSVQSELEASSLKKTLSANRTPSVETLFFSRTKTEAVTKPILKKSKVLVVPGGQRRNRKETDAPEELKMQRVRFHIEAKNSHDFGLGNSLAVWEPESRIVSRWQSILLAPLAYEAWAGAFRLALGNPQDVWLRYFDLASDVCFLLDGLVKMNTALRMGGSDGTTGAAGGQGALETSRRVIVKRLFLRDFPITILPSWVYLYITFSFQSDAKPESQSPNLWLWWAISIPRVLYRLLRLKHYFSSMEMNLNVSVSSLQLVKFALMIVMSAHWIGCLYFFAARVQPEQGPTWLKRISSFFPSFSKGTEFDSEFQLKNYILCLYKGVDGLAAIGYVPIVPTNSLEMILSLLVQYLAIWVSAYILGSLFHYLLVSQKDPLKEAQNKRMQDLDTFMQERRIPLATRKRLVEYFEFQYKKAVQRKASAALTLPKSLEVKVANARFRPTLQKCCNKGLGRERGAFYQCSVQFLNAMVTKLRPVFLMPGDQFIRESDMVLELCFVSSGYAEVLDGENVKRVIRSDVDSPSIVGEISFFLGVQQQHSVRAPASSDIELLVLSKEHADELFRDYPEQQEIITANLLTKYGMDSKGEDIEGLEANDDDEDLDAIAMRQILKDTVKRRHDESFQGLAWAVTSGDLEEVRRMLRKGVDINASNYDGKTVLHMAAVEGNYRVVELLLTEGAEKNARDRWGNTALQDAINHNQGPVIQLLVQWKSELNMNNAAGRLCDAASAGDLETLKLVLEHGVDPNVGDYDARTALHLSAAEGQDKAVQYLIAKGADVNVKDRWGATPLQDAVQSGHLQVAEQILSRGGIMTTTLGPTAMCNAATEGDVRYLKLLIRCGVDPDVGDYDFRCPMHLAAAEGRLLAVSYLLGVSANPNAKDRWGGTPMDDCVRGGTQRHLQCAKLLQCMGGQLGTIKKTTQGHEALSTLETIDMEDVRKVIKLLIDQGLDTQKPERATLQECVIAFEASVDLIQPTLDISRVFNAVTNLVKEESAVALALQQTCMDSAKQMARFLDKVNEARAEDEAKDMKAQHRQRSILQDANEFEVILQSGNDAEALDQFFEFEMDQQTLQMYAELDVIIAEQERDKFGSRSTRVFLAKEVNRCLMNLFKVEEMWRVLNLSFEQHGYSRIRHQGVDLFSLARLLEHFDLITTDEETRQIFREAVDFYGSNLVSPEALVVGSNQFQNLILEDDSDDIAQLLYRSYILRALSWHSMQVLCPAARRVKLRTGQTIRLKERSVLAVQIGSVTVNYLDDDGKSYIVQLNRDQVAGEVWALTGGSKITTVVAVKNTTIVLLSGKSFSLMFELYPQLFTCVCKMLVALADDAEDPKMHAWERKSIQTLGAAQTKKQAMRVQKDLTITELKELQGKDIQQRDFDLKVRQLMEHVRATCRPSWADSPYRQAYMAFIIWERSFDSKIKQRMETEEHERRLTIRAGFQVIENSWSCLSNGASTIYFTHVESLKDHLGEVGIHFFDIAFPTNRMKEELEFKDWVICWLRYLDGGDDGNEDARISSDEYRPFSANDDDYSESMASHRSTMSTTGTGLNLQKSMSAGPPELKLSKKLELKEQRMSNDSENWFVSTFKGAYERMVHTPITPLLEDADIAAAYEPSYIKITGDIKTPLLRKNLKEFLSLLLLDFNHHLTDMHVTEFMGIFSPEGPLGPQVTWNDIERGLRERSNKGLQPDRLFMAGVGSALNPMNPLVQSWRALQQLVALFFFIHVPVRIAFNPYPTMISWDHTLLCLDLVADILCFCNLLMTFNVSYMNKKSRWVSDRGKIARHYLSSEFWGDLICTVPLDWFGFLSGASQRLSSCFRLPKMLFVWSCFNSSKQSLITTRTIGAQTKMLSRIFMLLHVLTCIFFLLGNDGPKDVYTWYRHPEDQDSEIEYEYSGYGYTDDPDNSPSYRIWKQYLLSFYWVTSTVTTTGIIGDMHPKNYNELIFTMITLIINLTVFSYVIGQVSANVLKGDEKLLKAREDLGAVENYLKSFDFPKELKMEIKHYFQGAATSSLLSASEIFDSVSQSLRLEMSNELTRKCLDNCTLFRGCSQQVKDSIKGLLREVHFGSEEYLLQINTVAHDMFFIMSGKVEQVHHEPDGSEVVESRIGPGGAVGVLASYFGIRYMYSARASSLGGPCLCLKLVRHQLMPILKAYPDDEEVVAQNAMSEFQKVKQEKSINGNSTKGRSVKSGRSRGQMSIASERKIVQLQLPEEGVKEDEDGTEKSLETAYELENVEKQAQEQNIDQIILSGIEQRLASLNQRRKAERVAQFCNAASRGEIEKLDRAMRNGVHIDETDINGRTALHCAASEGRLEAVRHLLESRASINIQDNYKNTPLNDSVRHQHDAVSAELRKNGAFPITLPGFEMGVQMCTFAFEGDKAQLQRMITNRVDVNIADYDKRTALHLACCQGHVELVDFLLDVSAEVNCCDRMGFSPLVDALRHDQVQVQKLLRSKGGQLLGMDVSVELCEAASNGNVARMKDLITNGANPNAGDYDARTALHLAASNGQTSALDYMLRELEVPININPLDRLGGTPLEDAYRHEQSIAIAMLERVGGMRQDNPELHAMEEDVRAKTEQIQRKERYGKVSEMAQASPETKACSWVKGRCGKLLPGRLNELKHLSKDLTEEIQELNSCIDQFLFTAKPKSTMTQREALEYAMKSAMYHNVIQAARTVSDSVIQWRTTSQACIGTMSEDLPHVRAILTFSKPYKSETKALMEQFQFLSKVVQFWRFLILKIPEVRQAEEIETRNRRAEEDLDQNVDSSDFMKTMLG